jgi:hypothetical protein
LVKNSFIASCNTSNFFGGNKINVYFSVQNRRNFTLQKLTLIREHIIFFQLEDGIIHVGNVICDYMAFKEDEISVSKGEVVQILYTNQHNMFLVHRPANATSPAAEGWVPGYVIGPRDGDGSLRDVVVGSGSSDAKDSLTSDTIDSYYH